MIQRRFPTKACALLSFTCDLSGLGPRCNESTDFPGYILAPLVMVAHSELRSYLEPGEKWLPLIGVANASISVSRDDPYSVLLYTDLDSIVDSYIVTAATNGTHYAEFYKISLVEVEQLHIPWLPQRI